MVMSEHDGLTPIHVVGIGLDGSDGLSPSVQHIIHRATLLVGGDRHLSYFSDHPAQTCRLDALPLAIAKIQEHLIVSRFAQAAVATPDPVLAPDESGIVRDDSVVAEPLVVILASGDPLFYGIGRLLLQEFSPQNLTFHPHLSSIQLAFSRIKEPWQDAVILSVHGRSMDRLEDALKKDTDKMAVLTDATHNPVAIARLILALDRPHTYTIWVCENLGSHDETVQQFSADDLVNQDAQTFSALTVVILVRQAECKSSAVDPADLPVIGIPDSYFASFGDRPGLMTKREIRLMILGELALTPNSVIWDIGAGTGSVSIEIARLCPASSIYAIEKTAAGISLIQQNSQRFQVNTIHPIQGMAPQCLTELPNPDHVVIGGSGGRLPSILSICMERLTPGGTMVVAIATLERLNEAWQWLGTDAASCLMADHRLMACQFSRSVPVGALTRWSPMNPVQLLTLRKSR
jgi:precorrin-6Y C5,15-methyltransferase (decarboxylating)